MIPGIVAQAFAAASAGETIGAAGGIGAASGVGVWDAAAVGTAAGTGTAAATGIGVGFIAATGTADGIGTASGLSPVATFDGTASNVTLSNGNRTATHANATLGGARSTSTKTTGKWYFEITTTNMNPAVNFDCVGVLEPTGTYTDMTTVTPPKCAIVRRFLNPNLGGVLSNGASFGAGIGDPANQIIGIAVDFTNARIWFRVTPSGNWNGSGTANPATNTGGASISTHTAGLAPAVAYYTGNTSQAFVINAGQAGFNGSVPSGFTAGWN